MLGLVLAMDKFKNISKELSAQLETLTLPQLQQLENIKGTDLSKVHPIQIPGLIKACKETAAYYKAKDESKALVVSCESWRQEMAWKKIKNQFKNVDFENGATVCTVQFSQEAQAIDFAFKAIRHYTLLKNDNPQLIPPFCNIAHNSERAILWLGTGQDQVNKGTDYFLNGDGGYKVAVHWPGLKINKIPNPEILDDFIEKYLNAPENMKLLQEARGTRWTWFNRNSEDQDKDSVLELSYVSEAQIKTVNSQYAKRKPESKRGSWRYVPVQDKRWKYNQIEEPGEKNLQNMEIKDQK